MCESFNTSQAFSTLYIYMTYMFMTKARPLLAFAMQFIVFPKYFTFPTCISYRLYREEIGELFVWRLEYSLR